MDEANQTVSEILSMLSQEKDSQAAKLIGVPNGFID